MNLVLPDFVATETVYAIGDSALLFAVVILNSAIDSRFGVFCSNIRPSSGMILPVPAFSGLFPQVPSKTHAVLSGALAMLVANPATGVPEVLSDKSFTTPAEKPRSCVTPRAFSGRS